MNEYFFHLDENCVFEKIFYIGFRFHMLSDDDCIFLHEKIKFNLVKNAVFNFH